MGTRRYAIHTKINQILDRMSEVTPELVRSVAQEYLRPSNRTVVFLEPGAAELVRAMQRHPERQIICSELSHGPTGYVTNASPGRFLSVRARPSMSSVSGR